MRYKDVNEAGATAYTITSKGKAKQDFNPLYAEIAANDKGSMLLHVGGDSIKVKTSCNSVVDLANKYNCEVAKTMGD